MSAIEIRDVTKQFDAVVAVDQLTLTVPTGSIYGFIGPNGSGKTTTIRMIMNILVPDSGHIQVLGRPSASEVRDQVGYLPEERGLYKRMTVRQVLRYYGQLKGKSMSRARSRHQEVARSAAAVRLGRQESGQTLSKGMSQKVQFISTIVAEPKLLILDEPFSGLDPVNADALRDAVLDLRRQGTTVVFSTHDMSVAERLCDRIFMIFKGRKVLDGTLDDIQAQYGQDTVRVRTDAGAAALAGLPQVASFSDVGNFQDVRLKGGAQEFLHALSQKTAVHHFELKTPSLHDIFVRIAQPAAEELTVPAGAIR